ncbi:katanin p60 ATPase-containing subunit A-like 2 [Cotesia typhae]|uniref:katanin p60 ATPase-containing subunit A-like 2 n=1 Tax=Cotesia typhae TaxID=2053667 RepID=UPI003D6846F5
MLAKAVATECNWTFFNVTASSLVSKWRGDSEKYIRVLFEVANYQAPSIIFIDEIDWISGDNSSGEKSSEPARRFRAEFLTQLDGLLSTERNKVILFATTNAPWTLDSALLRRLEKQVYVDLPDENVRREILKDYTSPCLHNNQKFEELVQTTQYYSSYDLKKLCKEAWMSQLNMLTDMTNHEKNKLSQSSLLIRDIQSLQNAKVIVRPYAKNILKKYEQWKNRNDF